MEDEETGVAPEMTLGEGAARGLFTDSELPGPGPGLGTDMPSRGYTVAGQLGSVQRQGLGRVAGGPQRAPHGTSSCLQWDRGRTLDCVASSLWASVEGGLGPHFSKCSFLCLGWAVSHPSLVCPGRRVAQHVPVTALKPMFDCQLLVVLTACPCVTLPLWPE